MTEKIYWGTVDHNHLPVVTVVHGSTARLLPLRLDLENKSPTGFAWGYHGSGPAQLALALLAHATGDDDLALTLYQDFKRKVIATLQIDRSWQMTEREVRAHVSALMKERESTP